MAEKLLPRIFGFELLMAPYAVAHLKLGLLLQETGYEFQSDQRLGIYLTNTLEEAVKRADTLFARWITEEANAAAQIKREKPIMVVLGNPPYSVSSANKGQYIEGLMERYKAAVRGERNIQPLSDDYIKFVRFAHDRIERTGHGIIGMITNSSYLSGLIHRGMREELLKTFDEVYVLNLHGNAMLGEPTPNGNPDKNVFDIRQGVAIILLVRYPDHKGCDQVHYYELWGTREAKYDYLSNNNISSTKWRVLNPILPYFLFMPAKTDFNEEYGKAWSITDILPIYSSGIKTHRDHFVIDFDSVAIRKRIARFTDANISDTEVAEEFALPNTRDWKINKARASLLGESDIDKWITTCLYRPFDIRYIFYHPKLVELPRLEVMHHMLRTRNLGLVTLRINGSGDNFVILCSKTLIEKGSLPRSNYSLFPLYLYPTEGEMQFGENQRHPNLTTQFIKAVSNNLGLTFVEDGGGDLEQTFGPQDIFNYAYALFHSPTYRTRYADFLKLDFPRLPLTSNKDLFKALAAKGAELVCLHLMESPVLNDFITSYPIAGSNTVENVTYNDNTDRVYINKTQYFEGVPPEVWEFHIGGYQVCQKWLKDRKGRTLTYDELTHYQKVIVALKETIRLMTEIDELIPSWPVG